MPVESPYSCQYKVIRIAATVAEIALFESHLHMHMQIYSQRCALQFETFHFVCILLQSAKRLRHRTIDARINDVDEVEEKFE